MEPELPHHRDRSTLVRAVGAERQARANREFETQLGFTGEELRARPLLDWIHPDDQAELELAILAGAGGAAARHRAANGEWFWFDWQIRTHLDEVTVLGLGQRHSRATRKRAANATSTIRTNLSKVLDDMARVVENKNPELRCSILLLDEKHEYVTVGAGPSLPAEYNEAVDGLRIGPAVGSCGTAAFWNIPVIVEDIFADDLWIDLRDAAQLAGVRACWSQPIVTTSGDMLGAMALYSDEPRAPTRHEMDGLEIAARMVGLAVDRERLEERLRRTAKMEALGVLAGGVAHDFNNLLTVVLGNAELAMATIPTGNEAKERLEGIVAASASARELCDQMLAYAGRSTLKTNQLDLNGVVQETGALLQVALSKKTTLTFDLHPSPLGVQADRSQLRQVIMNLITNASEAIGNREGHIVVGTSARHYSQGELQSDHPDADLEAGDYVSLSTSDTGTGMSYETRSRVFDPFFTTKAPGRGLGLAAVQGIVQGHGGVIVVRSEPGSGTVFQILLPHSSAPITARPAQPQLQAAEPDGRILVVDDEPQVRRVLATILRRAGYDVIEAGDGQEAVDIFRTQGDTIDCVLLDLNMPKLDGEEAFHELQAIRGDVRILLSSGLAEQHVTERFRDAGLAGIVHKPTEAKDLLAQVASVLSGVTL